MQKILKSDHFINILVFFIVAFFFLFDIGNLDAIRQGTEGFYLQITKEMFKEKSFLTPLYMGENHWSKPPFQFWLALLFYNIFGKSSLMIARVSIALFSLSSISFISHWIKKHFNISFAFSLAFIASTVGILKYSRIFMMEITLSLLTVISVLKFYDYLLQSKKRDLFLASSSLTLGILVKGPVALVMSFGGISLYLIYLLIKKEKLPIKKFIYFCLLSIFISSFWFITCYLRYGDEFFNYFFLRENLGKFSAKSFPLRSVFQGLFLYGLPWTIYLPALFIIIYKRIKQNRINNINAFLLLNFLFFFLLWLIPSQRSHHYAIPSLPLLLILIIANYRKIFANKYLKYSIATFTTLFIPILLAILFIKNDTISIIYVVITILFVLFTIVAFFKDQFETQKPLSMLLLLGSIWTIILPLFYLPTVPSKVVNLIGKNEVAVVFRKPYYIEEALSKKIDAIPTHQMVSYISKNKKLYIVPQEVYSAIKLEESTNILQNWQIWKRNNSAKNIFNKIRSNSLDDLKETMLLLENR